MLHNVNLQGMTSSSWYRFLVLLDGMLALMRVCSWWIVDASLLNSSSILVTLAPGSTADRCLKWLDRFLAVTSVSPHSMASSRASWRNTYCACRGGYHTTSCDTYGEDLVGWDITARSHDINSCIVLGSRRDIVHRTISEPESPCKLHGHLFTVSQAGLLLASYINI